MRLRGRDASRAKQAGAWPGKERGHLVASKHDPQPFAREFDPIDKSFPCKPKPAPIEGDVRPWARDQSVGPSLHPESLMRE